MHITSSSPEHSLKSVSSSSKQKIIRVVVDTDCFAIDITDPNYTCGMLLQEVDKMYTKSLIQREKDRLAQGGNQQKARRMFIVSLKTIDNREGVDFWLNQFER